MPKNKKSLIFVIFRASTYNIEIEDFVLYGMTSYFSQTVENQHFAIPIAGSCCAEKREEPQRGKKRVVLGPFAIPIAIGTQK